MPAIFANQIPSSERTDRLRNHKLLVAAISVSAAFLLNDALRDWHLQRADLYMEEVARLYMLAVAFVIGVLLFPSDGSARQKSIRLVSWALVGISLDVYWQTAYSPDAAWVAMAVKYLALPAGLACLAVLVRPTNATIVGATVLAIAFCAAGFVHGILYIQSCTAYIIGECLPSNNSAIVAYHRYTLIDAGFRGLLVVLAAVPLLTRRLRPRETTANANSFAHDATFLAACILLSVGTMLDLGARNIGFSGAWRPIFQFVDAITTFAFPAALMAGISAGQLPDARVRRGLAFTIVSASGFTTFFTIEFAVTVLTGQVTGMLGLLHWIPAACLALIVTLFFRPMERYFERHVRANEGHHLVLLAKAGFELALAASPAEAHGALQRLRRLLGAEFVALYLGTRLEGHDPVAVVPKNACAFRRSERLVPIRTRSGVVTVALGPRIGDLRGGRYTTEELKILVEAMTTAKPSLHKLYARA
ncbi:MAG: hypothetical protein ACREMP_01290 [Candidatus Tyrphobacter sp.]